MQLSSLSKSLVAAALALGAPLMPPSAEAAPVAATSTRNRLHFVRLGQLLAKLVPTPPDTVGLYLWSSSDVHTFSGPDLTTACPPTAASCKALYLGQATVPPERLLVVTKTGSPWIGWDVLRQVRAAQASSLGRTAARDPERAAIDHLLANTAKFLRTATSPGQSRAGSSRGSHRVIARSSRGLAPPRPIRSLIESSRSSRLSPTRRRRSVSRPPRRPARLPVASPLRSQPEDRTWGLR